MFDLEAIYRAASVQDAIAALVADPEAVVIAGGTDVLIRIREGKLAGCRLVSIHDLPELAGCRLDAAGALHIGPLTCFRDVADDPLVQRHIPILAQAAGTVGGPQIRAMGTVGGNLCNGATSADTASSLFALNAVLTLTGPQGSRQLPVAEFYLGPGQVALQPGELLTDICIAQADYQGFGGCYLKYAMRNAMDIATLGTAVLARAHGAALMELRVAFGVAGPVPMRCPQCEAALSGTLFRDAERLIAGLVREEIHPRSSWRASREFRLQVAGENAARALRQAFIQAGGEV